MKSWTLASGTAEVTVNLQGGGLGPVRFRSGSGWLEPMHRAPWLAEPDAADTPMLQNLQGDFFCAPFGESDLLAGETRSHGLTANGHWRLLHGTASRVELQLDGTVSGARVVKEVSLEPGGPVVYQIHRFEGGEGRLPLGHHAMLAAPDGERLRLSFSPYVWAGTPPRPVEDDPRRGRSGLRYPQRIAALDRAETAGGDTVDLTAYPALEASEELVMLVTDPAEPFAWSAAVAPSSRWIWFALRPNGVLRSTLLWASNGGRDYPPFSGRHRRVLGIEEMTGYFHLGHRASLAPNEVNEAGHPTSVELQPGARVTTRYAFGAVRAPEGFERVATLRIGEAAIVLDDGGGRSVQVPFDPHFLAL